MVDCDLWGRSLQPMARTGATHGLLEVLAGEVGLTDAVVKDPKSAAHILALTAISAAPEAVFRTKGMDRLLGVLRSRYDLIVLDTAPVVPAADARLLASKADFVLFMARWRTTPSHVVRSALDLLAGSHVEVSGIALNRVIVEPALRGPQARLGGAPKMDKQMTNRAGLF
jgi:Mrp family chromosome partitioning ATPase